MNDDEIRIIRQIRHAISEECGHDVDRVVAYYRTVEDELKRSGQFRFASPSERSDSQKQPTGRVAPGGCPPGAPADPDVRN